VRRDSKSGAKGVRENPDGLTWSANIYRGDRCHHVGTFDSIEEAAQAYENALRQENPDLHAEREVLPVLDADFSE
jgi:hypothetical protein